MKLSFKTLCISILFLCVFAIPALSAEIEIEIDIAPATLNLAYQGQVVTVHTDIAYGLVAGASVELNGIPISWWKSDDRGYFVAKFDVDAVKEDIINNIAVPGTAVLALTGYTKDEEYFSGTSTIKVVNVGAK